MYADVIVDISVESLDRTFQYLIPQKLEDRIIPGTPVIIPFGAREISGYVIDISDKAKIDEDRIKPIIGIPAKRNAIDEQMINLAWWIKEQFGSTMNQALKTVIPISRKIQPSQSRTITPRLSREELEALCGEAARKKRVAQERFLRELIDIGELDYSLTIKKLKINSATINKFVADGVITITTRTDYRNPFSSINRSDFSKPILNAEQRMIVDSVYADLDMGKRADYLIHGVTGSGKTEVYLEIIEKVIEQGRQVIMLIPEIALTYQTVKRFYIRFGERISVMNSRLSAGERYDQYLRAKRGETDIVIGPRSALFMPFERLGLIIIDEEHENSYHSERPPAYSSREVALYRAQKEGASVILGSATPSVEAYTMAKAGRLKLFRLTQRAGGAVMPTVHVADMRQELANGNRGFISTKLKELMDKRLASGEQIILFLNRRGYSSSVSCRSCGHVVKCPHCDVSMTLHNTGIMHCHYCGFALPKPVKCPACSSPYISSFGLGTQKVEEKLHEAYPEARILRMDADTTSTKDSYDQILSAFANEEADILIGTQMIVKGHDFHKCTLVGILMADMSLFASDFRAGERTFQLITQASGRAGRGDLRGDVVIQTYNPEHYCIECAAKADYEGFYEEEIGFRSLMKYPPSQCMMSILVMSKNEDDAAKAAELLQKKCVKEFSLQGEIVSSEGIGKPEVKVIGPADAPIAKVQDVFRKIIYIKSNDYSLLVRMKNMITDGQNLLKDTVQLEFNFN